MDWIKFDNNNFPAVKKDVLCRVEYWKDREPAFFVKPKDRKPYYMVLHYDGTEWVNSWSGEIWTKNYIVTHWAYISEPEI